jgi:hypothetical protein
MFTDRYKNRTAGIIFFAVIDGGLRSPFIKSAESDLSLRLRRQGG